ncbi:MAG: helix-turn-helix domain-containing protein [Sphingomonas adhaesiva]|uniref:helix-turn-helix domain-containing protein n=1 Tax=Sphingomonas adhaesiva TaxID=28212 RepID=UPI002FFAB5AC
MTEVLRTICGDDGSRHEVPEDQIASPLYTTPEAAAYLRCSREWLEKQRVYPTTRTSSPAFSRVGRKVFYQKSELDAFIRRNTASSTSEYVRG